MATNPKAAASRPGGPTSSAKPLVGSALGVEVGVLVAGVPLTVAVGCTAASVCARAAWVSRAFTVAVAPLSVGVAVSVNKGVTGVFEGLAVAEGGACVGVRVGVTVNVGVLVICRALASTV